MVIIYCESEKGKTREFLSFTDDVLDAFENMSKEWSVNLSYKEVDMEEVWTGIDDKNINWKFSPVFFSEDAGDSFFINYEEED